jgi:hypothetical protein
MLIGLLLILIVLWFLGYINIQGFSIPHTTLFSINNYPVTLVDILILLVIAAVIGILPNPFRTIASVFLVLWVLSVLGILAFAGLSNLFVIVMIIGLVVYIFSGMSGNRLT